MKAPQHRHGTKGFPFPRKCGRLYTIQRKCPCTNRHKPLELSLNRRWERAGTAEILLLKLAWPYRQAAGTLPRNREYKGCEPPEMPPLTRAELHVRVPRTLPRKEKLAVEGMDVQGTRTQGSMKMQKLGTKGAELDPAAAGRKAGEMKGRMEQVK